MSSPYPIASAIGICDGFNLLLPNNLIADVASAMTVAKTTIETDWAIGELSWRGIELPVASIEQLVLQRAPRIRGSHVSILHGTLDTERLPFYGVPMQAIPHEFKLVKESDLTERSDDLDLRFCTMKVTARGVAAIIPDLKGIEEAILAGFD